MKRRREIGPKRQKNRPALIKYIIIALTVALAGAILAYVASWLIDTDSPPPNDTNDEAQVSFLIQIPGTILVFTLLAVLSVLFFGARAYMMGTKSRYSLLTARKRKIKR